MQDSKVWIPSAVPFFLFGFFYYLISPFFSLELFDKNSLLLAAHKYIDVSYFDFRYFSDAMIMLISWLYGYNLSQKLKISKKSMLDFVSSFKLGSKILFIILSLFFLLIIFKALSAGTVFFSGYSRYDIEVLGPFATILFIATWFLNYFSTKSIKVLFFIIFIFASFLMLGLGSRMFFVLGIITLILGFLSSRKKILYNPWFLVFLAFLALLVIGVGVWRNGGDVSIDTLVGIFFAEPLFTATSGSVYISNIGCRPLFGVPSDILASFINFIPSIFFPKKLEIINELIQDNNKFSPFGANALIANIYSNFGIFFPIYFFVIGSYYGFVRKKAFNSIFYRATYFSILPLLMFHFYREGFITVLKVMFYNAFVLPLIIIVLLLIFFRNYKYNDTNMELKL